MNANLIDVSIIIINYNTSGLINNCVKSIFEKSDGINYEIIIVDNATENLRHKIKVSSDERVKCIQLPENIGFGQANNAGMSIAKGRYIFCLNPDTLLVNNAVKILVEYMDLNPQIGACGGNLYNEDLMPALSFRRILPGIYWELNALLFCIPDRIRFGKNVFFNYTDTDLYVGYVSGADMMIRKSVVEETRGFSKDFFMYYEETDLCQRIKLLGYEIKSVPAAMIQHLEGRSFEKRFSENRIMMSERGRKTYLRRNKNEWVCRICDALHFCLLVKGVIVNCLFRRYSVNDSLRSLKIATNIMFKD